MNIIGVINPLCTNSARTSEQHPKPKGICTVKMSHVIGLVCFYECVKDAMNKMKQPEHNKVS